MKTESPTLHRYAIFVALCALLTIANGAVITSLKRPLATTAAVSISPALAGWHEAVGGLSVILMLVLAVWLASAAANKRLALFGWVTLATGLIVGGLGILGVAGILQALFAHIFFACIVLLALFTSQSWQQGPAPIEDSWHPSLRSLSVAMPAIVLLQITLGASYRYHALGVIWHILNAMLVLLLILIVAVFLTRQFPNHPTLKPAAVAVAVITAIQVLLGFTTFMMLILFPETSLAVVITSVLHVTTGALTLAASVVLAAQIRYNARPAGHSPVSDRQ
jgi:hypothetical protein